MSNIRRLLISSMNKNFSHGEIQKTPHNLTSNSSNPNFTLSMSDYIDDRDAWKAMDGSANVFDENGEENEETRHDAHSSYELNPYWQIRFNSPCIITDFSYIFRDRDDISALITNLKLIGSNDGVNWDDLIDFNIINTPLAETIIEVNNSTPYCYYRLTSVEDAEGYLIIGELEFRYIQISNEDYSNIKLFLRAGIDTTFSVNLLEGGILKASDYDEYGGTGTHEDLEFDYSDVFFGYPTCWYHVGTSRPETYTETWNLEEELFTGYNFTKIVKIELIESGRNHVSISYDNSSFTINDDDGSSSLYEIAIYFNEDN